MVQKKQKKGDEMLRKMKMVIPENPVPENHQLRKIEKVINFSLAV